jgi:MerR family transcriptional regulator, redox-sensitive transcriptional activator SoxR
MTDKPLRIGQVAERAGTTVRTVRYYEEVGLLPEPERVSGRRRYDDSVLRRLAVIDVAPRAGMSLHEIRLLVQHGTEPISGQLRELAARKLPEIDALIERAQRVRSWLETATGCDCQSIDDCALFDDTPSPTHQTPFKLPLSRITAGAA